MERDIPIGLRPLFREPVCRETSEWPFGLADGVALHIGIAWTDRETGHVPRRPLASVAGTGRLRLGLRLLLWLGPLGRRRRRLGFGRLGFGRLGLGPRLRLRQRVGRIVGR